VVCSEKDGSDYPHWWDEMNRALILLLASIILAPNITLQDAKMDVENKIDFFNESEKSNRRTIIVDQEGGGDYSKIQDAINISNDGDIINVYYGNYTEELVIDKSIFLIGIEKPILYTNKYQSCNIIITSTNVKVTNFFIVSRNTFFYNIWVYNSNVSIENISFYGDKGIYIDSNQEKILIDNCVFNGMKQSLQFAASNVTISNNFFNKGTFIDIQVGDEKISPTSNVTIYKNYFHSLSNDPRIEIYNGNYIYFQNNTFYNCETGIKCYHHSTNFFILGNTFNQCNEGFFLGTTSNIIIRNNDINHSKMIAIGECSNVLFSNNIISNNTGGLLVEKSNDLQIVNNTFLSNEYGINIKEIIDITIKDNYFYKNIKGLIIEESNSKVIWKNSFINNSIQASDSEINYWNKHYPSGGNYWSDYQGKDLKKGPNKDQYGSDGFGDETYINGNVRDSYPIFIDKISPRANGGMDSTIDQGYIFHFDSTGSTDDQLIHRVRWEFEYGGELKEFDMFEFDFKFDLSGFYPIMLTVYDFPGNSDTATFNITVKDLTPPIPLVQGDIVLEQGETAFFNASSSTDNSRIVNFTWTFQYEEEYIQLYGMTTSFKFDIPGYYTVTLLLNDTAENFASIKFNVTVIDTERPKAVAGEDVEIENGESVLFDASLSTDNGILVGFNWSFDYDRQIVHLEGKLTSFDFVKPGHYEVMLNVSDQFGNYDVDSLLVTVMDTHPPEAVIKGTLVQNPGGTIRLNGLSSTDNGRIMRYHWDFTDLGPMKVEGPYLNHTFERKGRHNVTMTVYDEWNLSGDITTTVDILDQQKPIAAAGEDATIPAGVLFTFNASGSTDDGMIVRYLWTFQYDGEEKRFDGEKVQFRFDKGGTYNVLLTVTDQTGNWGEDGIVLTVVDKGTLKGTVLNKNGSPLKGAKITVRASDGKDYLGITSANGSFIVEVFMGEATYKITKPGYKSISGAVAVQPMGITVLDTTGTTLEEEAKSAGLPLVPIIIGVGILLLIIGAVLFLLLRKKKGITNESPEETPVSEQIELPKEEGQHLEGELPTEFLVEEQQPLAEAFNVPRVEEVAVEKSGPKGSEMDEFFSEVENDNKMEEESKK
jgi:parallel beta-helix repeat protein